MKAMNLMMTSPGPHSKRSSELSSGNTVFGPQLCAISPEYALLGLSYVTKPHIVRPTHVLSGFGKLGWEKEP